MTTNSEAKNCISFILGIPVSQITDKDNIIDDLGADSIAMLELWLLCERKYNIQIPDEYRMSIRSVRDLNDLLTSLIK